MKVLGCVVGSRQLEIRGDDISVSKGVLRGHYNKHLERTYSRIIPAVWCTSVPSGFTKIGVHVEVGGVDGSAGVETVWMIACPRAMAV
jgi:hypothetical protein